MNSLSPTEVFAFRLGQARRMRGLSLRELSDLLESAVSHNALHKYEKAEMMPDGKVLVALCRALGQKPDFFFRAPRVNLSAVEFRKKASFSAKDEDALKEKAADFFERYLEVEDILGIAGSFLNPLEGQAIVRASDVEAAANAIRKAWKLGSDPLPGVVSLLEEKHLKVFEVDAPEEFEGFSGKAGDVPVIVLNQNRPPDRKRLTALHELGHIVLNFAATVTEKEKEKLCHAFATALLIPEEVFSEVFGGKRSHSTTRELIAIKERWGISCAAVMMRAASLGLIAPSSLRRFFTLWNEWGNRVNEPGKWYGQEKANRFEALVHRAAAEGQVTLTKGAYLAAQSVDEFRRSLQPVP
jgi:Zn-dependent peptidase ImmA (M78 family)/transcriptional regulator with XRE-family HTH domain